MRPWVRRIRGIIGTALTWGVTWFGGGLVLSLLLGRGMEWLLYDAASAGVFGTILGAVFSGAVRVLGRDHTFDQLSVPWFGIAGALVAAAFFAPMVGLTGGDPMFVGIFSLMGALTGAGTLALARRAAREPLGPGDGMQRTQLRSADKTPDGIRP